MAQTLSARAQTLYDAINRKTISNSYYDDERYNNINTPDLNKAYDCIQTLLQDPAGLAQILKEKAHPPSFPEIQTTMATYLKIALTGDFDSQLSRESDHEKNFQTIARLAKTSQQHPDLLDETLWEEETPLFFMEKGVPQKIQKLPPEKLSLGADPFESLPAHLHEKLREEAWSLLYISGKPLLTIACQRLFESTQAWRWDIPTPKDLEDLKSLAQTLERLPSFAKRLEETLDADMDDQTLKAHPEAFEKYAKKTLANPQEVPNFLAQDSLTHNVRSHLVLHYLTGKTKLSLLENALQKEKNKLRAFQQSLQQQNHLPI